MKLAASRPQSADVEVVMCTFNGERFVGEQMRSILTQAKLPARILVADDGSTDNTLNVVRHVYETRDTRAAAVQLVVSSNPQRLGPAASFSAALGRTTSPLVALADQDDIWDPARLLRTVELLDADPSLHLVGSDAQLMDADGRPLGRTLLESLNVTSDERAALGALGATAVFARRNLVAGMTMTMRRDLLDRALPVPPGWLHDHWLALYAASSGQFGFTSDRLVRYRMHDANVVGEGTRRNQGSIARLNLALSPSRVNSIITQEATAWSALRRILEDGQTTTEARAILGSKLQFERRLIEPRSKIAKLRSIAHARASGAYDLYTMRRRPVLRDLARLLIS